VLREDFVAVSFEPGDQRAKVRDRSAISPHRTCQIDPQAEPLKRTAYFADATGVSTGVFLAARRPFSQSCIISM
jgi:hypothetical protein